MSVMMAGHGSKIARSGLPSASGHSAMISRCRPKQGPQYIDLCDESDDEDVIVVEERIKESPANVSRKNLPKSPSNANTDKLRGRKRSASMMQTSVIPTHSKKLRVVAEGHMSSTHDIKNLSPPQAPPPMSFYLPSIADTADMTRNLNPVPTPVKEPRKRRGPFIIDSDSDTDEDMAQEPASVLKTPRPPSHYANPAKPFTEMTQHERRKWWHQLQALAKTKPELARRLIMQRKANLQSNIQAGSSSSAKIDDSKICSTVNVGNHERSGGDTPHGSMIRSYNASQSVPDPEPLNRSFGVSVDERVNDEPPVSPIRRSTGQIPSRVPKTPVHQAMASTKRQENALGDAGSTTVKVPSEVKRHPGVVPQPSLESPTLRIIPHQSIICHNVHKAATSKANMLSDASPSFENHGRMIASTSSTHHHSQLVPAVEYLDSSRAAAIPKAKNEKATQAMQKPIHDSTPVQDRKGEADQEEQRRRLEEDQEKRRTAYEKYLRKTAAEESAVQQQAARVEAAAEEEMKKKRKRENLAFANKERVEQDNEYASNEYIHNGAREQGTARDMIDLDKRKVSDAYILPARYQVQPLLRHERVSDTVLDDSTENEAAGPLTPTATFHLQPLKSTASPVLLPTDSGKHKPHEVNENKDLPTDDSSICSYQPPNTHITRIPDQASAQSYILGAFSANSINGQVKLGQSSVVAKPNPFKPQYKTSHKARAKTIVEARSRRGAKLANKFGELNLGDAKLYRRKRGHMKWKDLIAWYAHDTGLNSTEKQLRKRWQDMCHIIHEYAPDSDLISKAALGDNEALSELNTTIQSQALSVLSASTDLVHQTSVAPLHGYVKNHEEHEQDCKPSTTQGTDALYATFPGSDIELQQPQVWSIYGGKTMSLEAQIAYLQSLQEESAAFDGGESKIMDVDDDEDDNDITEEDCQQFVFSLVRREWSSLDPEDEYETIEDKPWLEYGRSFDNLCKANTAVAYDVLKAHPGSPYVADPDLEFTMQHRKNPADGTLHIIINSAAGTVECRVERRLRDASIRTLPHSKSDLAPRRTYLVLQREIRYEATDENLLEAPRCIEKTSPLDMTTHTTLRGANKHAIDQWLKATFRPISRNLNMREVETEKKREVLCIEFDVEGQGLPFRKSIKSEDDTEYELWVEEGVLAGPRNL